MNFTKIPNFQNKHTKSNSISKVITQIKNNQEMKKTQIFIKNKSQNKVNKL